MNMCCLDERKRKYNGKIGVIRSGTEIACDELERPAYGEGDNLNNTRKSYSYDWLNRLTAQSYGGQKTTYTYDARGNRIASQTTGIENPYTYTYTYDLNNKLLSSVKTTNPEDNPGKEEEFTNYTSIQTVTC